MYSFLRASALAVCLAGCTSYGAVHSPVTDDNAADLEQVVGTWYTEDLSTPTHLDVRRPAGAGAYDVTLRDTLEILGRLEVRVARFDDALLAAAIPAESEYEGTVLPLYQLYRLDLAGDSLRVQGIVPERLHELLQGDGVESTVELERDPELLFLATPSELTSLFDAHVVDEELWAVDEEATVVFVRVPAENPGSARGSDPPSGSG